MDQKSVGARLAFEARRRAIKRHLFAEPLTQAVLAGREAVAHAQQSELLVKLLDVLRAEHALRCQEDCPACVVYEGLLVEFGRHAAHLQRDADLAYAAYVTQLDALADGPDWEQATCTDCTTQGVTR